MENEYNQVLEEMSIANTEHSENLAVDTNIAIISGVLDDAPRIMHTKNNDRAISFNIAVLRTVQSAEGVKTYNSWFNIASFNESVVTKVENLAKGSKVLVQGAINVRTWVDQANGQKRTRYEIITDQVTVLNTQESEGADINMFILSGALDSAPKITYTKNNNKAVSFNLAVAKIVTNDQGSKTYNSWFNIASFNGAVAESAEKLSKGSKVAVQGMLSVRNWIDQNTNEKRIRYEIVIDRMIVLGEQAEANYEVDSDIPDEIFS